MSGHDERPVYRPRRLAERLGVSERTAREMIAKGEIRSYRVRGARVVDAAEVDRYLDAQRALD